MLAKVQANTTQPVVLYRGPTGKKASVMLRMSNATILPAVAKVALVKADDLGIAAVNVTASGTGLTAIPTLTLSSSDGFGSDATAAVTKLTITEFAFAAAGTGYHINDILSTGAESTAARIKVTSVNAEGVILTAALVSLAGTNIFTVPVSDTISLQGGNGTGATISTASLSYGIKEVTVTAPGNNYKGTTITVTPSAGTGATFTTTFAPAELEPGDYLEPSIDWPANSIYEMGGITLNAGDTLVVQTSVPGTLTAFLFGVEALA